MLSFVRPADRKLALDLYKSPCSHKSLLQAHTSHENLSSNCGGAMDECLDMKLRPRMLCTTSTVIWKLNSQIM